MHKQGDQETGGLLELLWFSFFSCNKLEQVPGTVDRPMPAAHACSSGTPQLVLQWNEVPWCFLGDTATKANNWEGLAEALKQKLLKWKGLLTLLLSRPSPGHQ